MVQHYQPHHAYPLPSPPRQPLQPSPYQNEARASQLPPPIPPPSVASPDAYSMWERKVYTSLQPSRPTPYPMEMHRPSRLPAVYNPVPQPPSLSPGLSGGNSVEYASCSTSGTPCDFHHNDQFTPPAQSEAVYPIAYRRSPPQLPMPSNSGEPVFPPPLEASRFPAAQAPPPPSQAFPSSPMSFAQRRPSSMPLPPFYPQPSLCNGRGAVGGGMTAGAGAPAFMEPNFDGIQPTPMMLPQGSSGQLDGPRRKNATRQATAYLKKWLSEHSTNPYPSKNEKIMLAFITKMSFNQISTWFANARRRLKKENKMTWSPKTGSTESRPRVPELVRGESEECSEGRASSRLETVSECDQPLGHGQQEDPFAGEEAFPLAFTGVDVRPPLPPAAVFPHPTSDGEGATAFVYGSGSDEAMFCHADDYFTNSTEDEGRLRSHLTSIH